jgi:hypothetical protein
MDINMISRAKNGRNEVRRWVLPWLSQKIAEGLVGKGQG